MGCWVALAVPAPVCQDWWVARWPRKAHPHDQGPRCPVPFGALHGTIQHPTFTSLHSTGHRTYISEVSGRTSFHSAATCSQSGHDLQFQMIQLLSQRHQPLTTPLWRMAVPCAEPARPSKTTTGCLARVLGVTTIVLYSSQTEKRDGKHVKDINLNCSNN